MRRLSKILVLGVITVFLFSLSLPAQQLQLKPVGKLLRQGVTLKVKPPANYTGACPHTFVFEGTIFFANNARVSYWFKRSDGVTTRKSRPLLFIKGGKIKKTLTWKINKTYSGWVEFYATIGKKKIKPKRANFSTRCLAKPLRPVLKPHKSLKPVRVKGVVSIVVRPTRTLLLPSIRLYRGTSPLSGMRVVVDGNTIPEQSKGHHRKEINGYSPSPGKLVNVEIGQKRKPLPLITRSSKIKASAITGKLVSFVKPATSDTTIKLVTLRGLQFEWAPSSTSVNVSIYELIGKTAGPRVFNKQNVGGGKISVPATAFAPNKKYGIYLSHSMGPFSFKGKVAAGSKLSLYQSVGRYFYTK